MGVVLYDPVQAAMMVVHCGRHTVLQEGAKKAVEFMGREAGTRAEDVLAWLSPAAGKENYPLYDLSGASLMEVVVGQLVEAGVIEAKILKSEIDTTTDADYFSHSQGDREERFAIVGVID